MKIICKKQAMIKKLMLAVTLILCMAMAFQSPAYAAQEDDYILGTQGPETAVPVIPEKKPVQEEQPPAPTEPTVNDGCQAMVPIGAGAVLLAAVGVSSVLTRKRSARR